MGKHRVPGGGPPRRLSLGQLADAPVSWASLSAVHTIDPRTLSPEKLPAFLKLAARVEAHASAQRVQAVAALSGTSDARDVGADVEVSVATPTTLTTAGMECDRAKHVVRMLPLSLAATLAGEISPAQLRRIADATAVLDDPQLCTQVETRVLVKAPRQSCGELTRALNRAVATADPDAFDKAHRHATQSADVTLRPVEAAMGLLSAYLPLVDATRAMAAVDDHARTRKAAGDPRPLGQLRVEELLRGVGDY